MPSLTAGPRLQFRLALILLGLLATSASVCGQRTSRSQTPRYNSPQPVSVRVNVRDERGSPLGVPAIVQLRATVGGFDSNLPTRDGSAAEFPGVHPGQYEIEVRCVGYKTTSEQLSVAGMGGGDVSVFVYIRSESDAATGSSPASGVVMTPKLQAEIDKGFDAMRKDQYEAAKLHFEKAVKIAPSNVEVLYLLATAELALHQSELARQHFEEALKLNPGCEKAGLAMGEMQLQSGDTGGAITTLEKAYDVNGASWRTHLLLASAYAKAGRLEEAEKHAQRAASLAKEKGAHATFFLGEIQDAEGKATEAKSTWELVVAQFPNDPVAAKAKEKLAEASEKSANNAKSKAATLPPPPPPVVLLAPVVERPWAPPDVDSMEYRLALDAPCKSDEVLARAQRRMSMQLDNFERFTATERIEHQQIDRYGMPGPALAREFSYIVFVHPYKEHSVYLEESRNGTSDTSVFPTSLATIGLNGLGVSILQPANQNGFIYKCEGLTSVRGQAAWQIRFEENSATTGFTGVREWRKNGILYDIPIKGRIWVASSSFDLLRVETDLIAPIDKLGLSRDHLIVDYGPVSFQNGSAKLWLPWTAEMYMELHGKRYHHRHFLTDYMLFEVDTSNKVHKPKQPPPVEAEPGN